MPIASRKTTSWLSRAPKVLLNGYLILAAFTTYFCMYAFRKPFTAATYEGLSLYGTQVELKTAFVISQIIGYTLSKFVGIKFCSEATRGMRAGMLVFFILFAETALIAFAVLPTQWKVVALFFNGLPLGMVWGIVVQYLEGRRSSDVLLAGLACSFIVSSGVVKDVGRALLAGDPIGAFGVGLFNPLPPIGEFWMPAATGIIFLPPFLLSVWLLNQAPEPTTQDVLARTVREPMNHSRRNEFLRLYLPGLVSVIAAYVLLTAFRDYRDNFAVEILDQLGYPYSDHKFVLSRMELIVAIGVIATMALLYAIKDNRRALLAVFCIILAGLLIVALATLLYEYGQLSGLWWMALVGLGSYMAYVPFNTVLFDRLFASTRFVGTAVFGIYLADSGGYSGSIVLQLGKDLFAANMSRLEFMLAFAWFLSFTGSLLVMAGCLYFWRRGLADRALWNRGISLDASLRNDRSG
jgi:Family of unknown function (DUF5690)